MSISMMLTVGAVLSVSGSALGATVINFDELPGGNGAAFSGSTYAAQGVTMTQVNSAPDALLNAMLSISTVSNNFLIYHQGAVSPDVYAFAEGTRDMLFSFSAPVSTVSLDLDTYSPEGGDIVRLAALVYDSGLNQYLVIASEQALDNPGNLGQPANITLTVAPGQSFVHALFQSTSEQEGFDNLSFVVVPLPTGVGLAGIGLFGVAMARRRFR
jgi:hypothetical protein